MRELVDVDARGDDQIQPRHDATSSPILTLVSSTHVTSLTPLAIEPMNETNMQYATGICPAWALLLVCTAVLQGCGSESSGDGVGTNTGSPSAVSSADPQALNTPVTTSPELKPPVTTPPVSGAPVQEPTPPAPASSPLQVPDDLFTRDGYGTPVVIRLDVRTDTTPGVCNATNLSGCTLADVLADTDGKDDVKIEIPVHFSGADYPDDGAGNNAEFRQRGATSRRAPQKSFRVKLDKSADRWRNERRLQLNKHPFDKSRIRNKLSFDLMSALPELPSSRTQFVNLWIDDGQGPVDQGLYTHVEAAGKEFLKNRNWNPDDRIYKSEFFRFSEDDLAELALDSDGKPLDTDRFEKRLEIETGKDHSRLVSMLRAINDPAQDFAAVFERHFDADNVLTWVTVNFLLGQRDASAHNFYLYNPVDSDKFYFMPWDYDNDFYIENILIDDDFTTEQLEDRLRYGYARGSISVFLDHYYRLPGAHEAILARADRLRAAELSDASIMQRFDEHIRVVRPFVTRLPDSDFVRGIDNVAEYDNAILQLPTYVADNHASLQNDFGIPMPPVLKMPHEAGDSTVFSWTPAFDVTGHTLTYDLEVSTSDDFATGNVAYSVVGLPDARREVTHAAPTSELPSGILYYRVIARSSQDPMRFWQVASNKATRNGKVFWGQIEFSVP